MNMAKRDTAPDQAAVVPFRRRRGELEICLTYKPDKDSWGIPKGFIDAGCTAPEAALVEAREEAGLRGLIIGDPVGHYDYRKWGGEFRVVVYLMEVARTDATWLEIDFRERHWLPPQAARRRAAGRPFAKVLKRALARLADGS